MSWSNWAGNQRTTPVRTVLARSAAEVAAAVVRAADEGHRVSALGSGHSFSGIGVPDGVAVRPPSGPGIVVEGDLAHVPAGMTLRTLNDLLWEHGRALPNLGDIDAQTVSGALATGTHGTGAGYRGIAAQVRGFEIVLADGSVVRADGDLLRLGRIGLGALGVVTSVTLETVPAFALRARERLVPLEQALELATLDADHAEFYWFPHTEHAVLKSHTRTASWSHNVDIGARKRRYGSLMRDEVLGNGGFALVCALGDRVPALVPRLNRVSSRLMPAGEYTDRSYRVFCSPRRVRFVEMEYAVPLSALGAAFAGLRSAAERYARAVTVPVEVRLTAADDVPLSMAYGRESAYLAVHVHAGQPYEAYFAAVEQVMTGLDGRPHWGKVHTRTAADLRTVHPCLDEFRALQQRLDPGGLFHNPHRERVLG
ncbi:D-arabinono-1,4-lactone oxidase [Pseudonocardia sp. WMMC193]|uniref:D-arabinono-1,4-lactone oxidase n=1 Tax=Pseudonocardia sp. WMMC193 TaxID=2911965 RepID=UPI001F3619DE|nr:D-arabinono-1,4-lactone oxidase [Pseudonocardia sp. WMMC193]MCF7547859.1 FAD-binding protein [Pseudonocardia sp. WMMC193]